MREPGNPLREGDALVAVLLLVVGVLELALQTDAGNGVAAYGLSAGAAVAAVGRRRFPFGFAAVALAVTVCRAHWDISPMGTAVFTILTPLALYGIGAHGRRGTVASASLAAAGLAVFLGVKALLQVTDFGGSPNMPAAEWFQQTAIWATAAAGGVALRDRTAALSAARERLAAMPSPESDLVRAIRRERGAIAGELQGVVARCVAEVLADAGRARAELAGGRSARGAIHAAQAASKRAMAEMRRMLLLLREERTLPGDRPEAPAAGSRPWEARIPALVREQAVPLLVLVAGAVSAALNDHAPDVAYGTATLPVRLLGVTALALAFVPHRSRPLVTAIAASAVMLIRVNVLDDYFPLDLYIALAAFACGAHGRSLAVGAFGGLFVIGATILTAELSTEVVPVGAYVFISGMLATAWLTGWLSRSRLGEAAELRAAWLEEEALRAAAAERAAEAERLRVARELHDLVGHALTSITLQCAAADRLLDSSPDEAGEAIGNVARLGSEAVEELDGLLELLGSTPGPRGLGSLDALVAGAREGGEDVWLEAPEDIGSIPEGQSAAAYRIVQEALTNARKHGAHGEVRVALARDGSRLTVKVESATRGGADRRAEGLGLIGMRERASIYGGSFEAGPAPGREGVWAVRAELPLEDEVPVAP